MKKGTKITSLLAILILCAGVLGSSYSCPEQAKLLASDGSSGDRFGSSVSISGDYCIVGAYYDDDNGSSSGSAYMFKRDGENWVEQVKLLASDGAAYDWFGSSVSISGDYCIVGAPYDDDNGSASGSAYIFKRDDENWAEQAKLLPSDGDLDDHFSRSVSISGDYCIVGASANDDNGDNSGSAYIFKRDGENWVEHAKLLASDGSYRDSFGGSVSISGDYCVVGAIGDDDNGSVSGSAYIFKRDAENWAEQAKLLASDGAAADYFGYPVSISGDYCIIGARYDDDNGDNSGSAYIFERNGENWLEQAKLLPADGDFDDHFSGSVSISGDHCIIGAYYDDANGTDSGSAYIFARDGGTWLEQAKLLASDGSYKDYFGCSVSISGDYCMAGAYADNDNGTDSGSAYIAHLSNLEPGTLADLQVEGLQDVGATCPAYAYYTATAYNDNGCIKNVTDSVLWWVEPEGLATLDANGLLHIQDINTPQDITIYAQYTEGNMVLQAEMTVKLYLFQTFYVPADYETIQAAIDAADCNATIIVADGVYTGEGNHNIDFLGKAMTVKSENGPENCIIDCNALNWEYRRGFEFVSGEGPDSVLQGFTITKGFNPDFGGAIYCEESGPTIANCIIKSNIADHGGGIGCYLNANPIIAHCTFIDNFADGDRVGGGGGAIACRLSSLKILSCTMINNKAGRYGGAIYCGAQSSLEIDNSTLSYNYASGGGGAIAVSDRGTGTESSVTVTNCNISSNKAKFDQGAAIYFLGENLTISKCHISGNRGEGFYGRGAIYCSKTNLSIHDSVLAGNFNYYGAALYCNGSTAHISNCTFTGNSAKSGSSSALYAGGTSEACLTDCILWDTGDEIWKDYDSVVTINHSDVRGGWPGQGNIDANPGFFAPGYWADANDPDIIVEPTDPNAVWVDGDYHLMENSFCADAGDPNYILEPNETDLDGNPRVRNGRIDMGAYESPQPYWLISTKYLSIMEGQTDTFTLALKEKPQRAVHATVAKAYGDADIQVLSGHSLLFTRSNWSVPQTVTLKAQMDNNVKHGTAVIAVNTAGKIPAVILAAEKEIISVNLDGSGNYTTIQEAIDAAYDGDIVIVADGIYTGDGNRDLDFLGKAVTVKSENGPENCIIDCNATREDQHHGFHFHSGESPDSVVNGFSIMYGYMSGSWEMSKGGGILCEASSPTIKNCIVKHCARAAIGCFQSSPIITGCTISDNYSSPVFGGGIYCEGSSPVIKNCVITNNRIQARPPEAGGGIYCRYCSPTITNCLIAGNMGGIAAPFCNDFTINNCTITENLCNGVYCSGDSVTINNSIIRDNVVDYWPELDLSNASVTFSNVPALSGTGNIHSDPCFVQAGSIYWDDNGTTDVRDDVWLWSAGNYHLLPSSPCIDTGDPNYLPEPNEKDLDGGLRVFNGRIDMGAYEYTPPVEVELTLTPQMLNCDSRGNWLKAHVTFPEQIYFEDIDVNAPALADPPGVESEFIEVNEYSDGQFDVQIYFDRESFCDVLSESEDDLLEVTVTGSLTDGRKFQGSDTIKLKIQPRHHRIRQNINRERILKPKKTKR